MTGLHKRILNLMQLEGMSQSDIDDATEIFERDTEKDIEHWFACGIYATAEYYDCPNCGEKLKDYRDSKFCLECGQRLNWE